MQHIDDLDIELDETEEPTAVKFEQDGCVPCERLNSKLEDLEDELDIRFSAVDVEDNLDIARDYGVRGTPTVVYFDEEGEEIDRFSGDMDKEKLEEWFEDLEVK